MTDAAEPRASGFPVEPAVVFECGDGEIVLRELRLLHGCARTDTQGSGVKPFDARDRGCPLVPALDIADHLPDNSWGCRDVDANREIHSLLRGLPFADRPQVLRCPDEDLTVGDGRRTERVVVEGIFCEDLELFTSREHRCQAGVLA